MERIFAFLQYMYSVLLHANEPAPERRFVNREETVFSMADFSRYWQDMSGAWKLVVDHSSYPYQYVNVEVWYELPAFVCAAIRTTNHPLIQTKNSHGYSIGADGVTIYVDTDSPEDIRRKILRLEDSIAQVWAGVISILDDLHHPEIFKKPKLWAWWKAEVANFLHSAQDTAFLRRDMEPNTKGSAHAMDGWEFVGDKAGFYSSIVEIWARKAAQ